MIKESRAIVSVGCCKLKHSMLPIQPSATGAAASRLAYQSASLLGFRFPAVRCTQRVTSGILSPAIASKHRHLQCQVRYKIRACILNTRQISITFTLPNIFNPFNSISTGGIQHCPRTRCHIFVTTTNS